MGGRWSRDGVRWSWGGVGWGRNEGVMGVEVEERWGEMGWGGVEMRE